MTKDSEQDVAAAVQKTLDHIEIMQVLYGWMRAQDQKDWAGLHAFLTPESTFASPRFGLQRGPAQVEANVKRALGHIDATLHVIMNEVVEINGDEAKATFNVNAHHLRRGTAGGEHFTNRALHKDDLVRTPDGWKIKHVEAKALWGEGNPQVRVKADDAQSHVKAH